MVVDKFPDMITKILIEIEYKIKSEKAIPLKTEEQSSSAYKLFA